MIDIRQQLFKRVYQQCQYLLVPEFTNALNTIVADPDVEAHTPSLLTRNPNLGIPSQFQTDEEINALTETDIQTQFPDVIAKYPGTFADKGALWKRAIRQIRNIAFIDHENYITTQFPQFGERIVRYLRPDAIDVDSLAEIDAIPALMIAINTNEKVGQDVNTPTTTTLGTTEKQVSLKIRLALTEEGIYNAEGTGLDLQKSRTGRVFHIWGQLRQVLDMAFFQGAAATFPQYKQKSEILKVDLSTGELKDSEILRTIFEYKLNINFREQITR